MSDGGSLANKPTWYLTTFQGGGGVTHYKSGKKINKLEGDVTSQPTFRGGGGGFFQVNDLDNNNHTDKINIADDRPIQQLRSMRHATGE